MNKKHGVLALTLALLFALTFPRALAQTAETSSIDQATKAKVQARLQQMSSELNLSDHQKTELKPLLETEFQQLKAVRDNTSLTPDQKRVKARQIHEGFKSQMAHILTPEQEKKLATMRQQAQKAPK